MDFTELEPKLEYGKYYSNKYVSISLAQEIKSFSPLFITEEKGLVYIMIYMYLFRL